MAGTLQEIEKQDRGSFPEMSDSLISANRIALASTKAASNIPSLHVAVLTFINNPTIYRLADGREKVAAGIFQDVSTQSDSLVSTIAHFCKSTIRSCLQTI